MLKAKYKDKQKVVNILVSSFTDNKSVNYIIKQDKRRLQRIMWLMEYSFDVCYLFGDVFLADDKAACALIILPDKKRTTLKSILLDVKFALKDIGLSYALKAMTREAKIKKIHPDGLMYYLWFIGVEPEKQNKGLGSQLLKYVVEQGLSMNRQICLETSTVRNLPWYKKFGFEIYKELDFGYKLYCMKKV